MSASELSMEWKVLQAEFDSYEKHALYIKLTGFVLAFGSGVVDVNQCLALLVIFLLWGQEAIWKTYQSRIEQRLIKVESALSTDTDVPPCQFNNEFLEQRQGVLALVVEYAKQAVRPTVAFPYPLLIVVVYILG